MWANPNVPSLGDYVLWIRGVVGIDPLNLPDGSPFFQYALNRALGIVLNIPAGLTGLEYTLAVYNCATHIQIKITPDQVAQGVARTYFLSKRSEFQLLQPVIGLPLSSSDNATSVTNAVPEAMRELTIQDLDFMKTPWGREYLMTVQDYGPTVWGLS